MQTLQRGQKVKLGLVSPVKGLQVGLTAALPGATLDCSCFGLDENGKLSDDRYLIFYNQKSSPCGGIVSHGPTGGDLERFAVNLDGLPSTIRRLVFVITVDGTATTSSLGNGCWRLYNSLGAGLIEFPFHGSDFGEEKALIAGELYFKDEWRIAAVGQGFKEGLEALLKHFGGEECSTSALEAPSTSSAGDLHARGDQPPSSGNDDRKWFFLDALNQSIGPVRISEIEKMQRSCDLFVWTEGMSKWVLASECLPLPPEMRVEEAVTSRSTKKPGIDKKRKLGRETKELLTICRGVIADGVVTPAEVQLLNTWLKEHPEVRDEWPANILSERISQVLADGVVDASEQEELQEILTQITDDPSAAAIPSPNSGTMPYDFPLPEIQFEERVFTFIGKFVYGIQARCQHAVTIRGGTIASGIYDDVDYVVLGTLGTKGEQIRGLTDLRRSRRQVSIVPESHWHEALTSHSQHLILLYGEDESCDSGIISLPAEDFVLPVAKGWFAVTVTVPSFSGPDSYNVDLTKQTCSCPDFVNRRRQFSIGDVRRACKHLCRAIIEKPLDLPPFLRETLLHRISQGRGFPSGEWFEWCDLDGHKVFIGANHGGWVNLFAPRQFKGDVGAYDEFGYSTYEQRWSYGERPFRSRRLERFIEERSR